MDADAQRIARAGEVSWELLLRLEDSPILRALSTCLDWLPGPADSGDSGSVLQRC